MILKKIIGDAHVSKIVFLKEHQTELSLERLVSTWQECTFIWIMAGALHLGFKMACHINFLETAGMIWR